MTESCNPILVEVLRGEAVESRHRGAAAVIRSNGELVASWGDIQSQIFARSAIKPIQALPLIETGAADRFQVSDEEIALACASHSGQAMHIDRVYAWLSRLGLGGGDLVCGSALATGEARASPSGAASSAALQNNCSGKHTGFLTTALHLGEPVVGYAGPAHPVQLRVRQVLSQIADTRLDDMGLAVDGCGVPTFALPLRNMALAIARLADPGALGRLRGESARRLVDAMIAHPRLVGGDGQFDTRVMEAAGGSVITKGGAEAVHIAALPRLGIGIALKIDDGSKRAALCAIASLLAVYADSQPALAEALALYREAPVRNAAGARVGTVRAARGWLA